MKDKTLEELRLEMKAADAAAADAADAAYVAAYVAYDAARTAYHKKLKESKGGVNEA